MASNDLSVRVRIAFTILTLTLTNNPNSNPNRYLTIKKLNRRPGLPEVYDIVLGTPNKEIRESLEQEMSNFLIGKVSDEMLRRYALNLQQLDFDAAAESLENSFRSSKK